MMTPEQMEAELAARQKEVWKLKEELSRTRFTLARLDIDRDMMRQDLHHAAEQIANLSKGRAR